MISLLIIFVLFPLLWNISSTTGIGGNDFVGYWSGTHLFYNGQNPYAAKLLDDVQHTYMQSDLEFTVLLWNPPTLFVFLLPLALLPFVTAKFFWLLINLIVILTSILMLSRLYLSKSSPQVIFIYFLFAAGMPQVMTGLYMGQVTFLTFFALVASMALIRKEQWFYAGAVLIFTSIKPHIAILAVIYLLVIMAQQRKYAGWMGLFCAGMICLAILFIFRPSWISDFSGILAEPPVQWVTPTVGGLLNSPVLSKYSIILLLPLPFLLAKYRETVSMEFSIALLTVITVPFTFFGWSYDQTILLIPMAQIFYWVSSVNNKPYRTGFALVTTGTVLLNYWQRTLDTNEVYYVWVSLFWCLAFGLTWFIHYKNSGNYE